MSNNGFPPVDSQLNHFFAGTQACGGLPGVFANPDGVCVQKGFLNSAPFVPVGPATCQMEKPDLDLRAYRNDLVTVQGPGGRKSWADGTHPAPARADHFCPRTQSTQRVPGADCYFRA